MLYAYITNDIELKIESKEAIACVRDIKIVKVSNSEEKEPNPLQNDIIVLKSY